MRRSSWFLFVLALACIVPFAGCSTAGSKSKPAAPKPEVTHERGWIGGEYAYLTRRSYGAADAIHLLPGALTNSCRDALLVTALASNSPARLAGVQEGDLILEVNHQPVTTLRDFRRTIDQSQPGTPLSLLVWRDGRTIECHPAVGRETYAVEGSFWLELPFYDGGFNPCFPGRGFSLWALGYRPGTDQRLDLETLKESAKENYFSRQLGDKYQMHASEPGWFVWLACFGSGRNKTIRSQENVAHGASDAPVKTAAPNP